MNTAVGLHFSVFSIPIAAVIKIWGLVMWYYRKYIIYFTGHIHLAQFELTEYKVNSLGFSMENN